MGEKVAFLGLGVMGFPMARHLAAKGHAVTVYNRNAAKAADWVSKHGGRQAATPREAAAQADIVFACDGADRDLRQIAYGEDGLSAGLAKGAIFVDHTTASADVARELALEQNLLAIPGTTFGAGQERHIRFAFANVADGRLAEIGDRLERLSA